MPLPLWRGHAPSQLKIPHQPASTEALKVEASSAGAWHPGPMYAASAAPVKGCPLRLSLRVLGPKYHSDDYVVCLGNN